MKYDQLRATANSFANKSKTAVLAAVKDSLTFERVYAGGIVAVYGLLFAAAPAEAQATLRSASESAFNTIYGVVGAVGGVATLTALVNWKMGNIFGASDPKKTVIHALMGTGGAFGVVGIIQAIKTATSAGSSISGV